MGETKHVTEAGDDAPGISLIGQIDWQLAMGADTAIGEEPRNWLAEPAVTSPSPIGPPKTASPASMAVTPSAPLGASEARDAAEAVAARAHDLAALKQAIADFDGSPLRETATNLVFADGNPEAPLMLVGEAPGADEDRQGLPFVGVSGRLLDHMLAAVGVDRSTCYITNVVNWRPPGNRKPSAGEVATFLPFVRRHVDLVNPAILVLVGDTAVKAFLDLNIGITRSRGRWYDYRAESGRVIPTLPVFHPAFLLRSPAQKKLAWRDMLEMQSRLAKPQAR